jgi:hypothetical protein
MTPENASDESFAQEDIAAVAQQIWEEEGRPEGQAAQHWERAKDFLRQRDGGSGDGATSGR